MNYDCNKGMLLGVTALLPNGFPLTEKQLQTSPLVYTVVQNDLEKMVSVDSI